MFYLKSKNKHTKHLFKQDFQLHPLRFFFFLAVAVKVLLYISCQRLFMLFSIWQCDFRNSGEHSLIFLLIPPHLGHGCLCTTKMILGITSFQTIPFLHFRHSTVLLWMTLISPPTLIKLCFHPLISDSRTWGSTLRNSSYSWLVFLWMKLKQSQTVGHLAVWGHLLW